MSVACPATRRDGRRRLRLRKRKEPEITLNFESEISQTSNLKLRKWDIWNLKLQTWNFKVRKWKSSNLRNFKLETSKLRSQTWNLKLRKWKSSKLRAESFQLLSFDKLQVLKLRIRTACSKLSYQSWKLLKVVECWKLLNLESCQSWILKVVRHWKWLNVEVVESSKLNVESCRILWKCWILKVC